MFSKHGCQLFLWTLFKSSCHVYSEESKSHISFAISNSCSMLRCPWDSWDMARLWGQDERFGSRSVVLTLTAPTIICSRPHIDPFGKTCNFAGSEEIADSIGDRGDGRVYWTTGGRNRRQSYPSDSSYKIKGEGCVVIRLAGCESHFHFVCARGGVSQYAACVCRSAVQSYG